MDLERLGIDASVEGVFPTERLVEALADTPIEVVQVAESGATLDACQAVVTLAHREAFLGLDWVHSIQAGVDRFPHDRFREEGVILTNSSGIHGDVIGETVAGYVLSFARRLHVHVANQRERAWRPLEWDAGWTVAGERACVVGVGSLGRGVIDRLTGLGMEVVGVRRRPLPEPGLERVYTPDALEEAVAGARFVVLTVPLTPETAGLIDADALAAMDEDAYLINVARGGVLEEDALVDALEAGTIAGAALDVFETEPLPERSPFWELEDVIVTPHCGSAMAQYYRRVGAIVAESTRRVRAGEDPVNRVV